MLNARPRRYLTIGEIRRAPRFLENPCLHASLFDPGGSSAPRHPGAANIAFRTENHVGSANTFISRLHHAACKPPVYASQPRSPSHHATLGPSRWLAFAGAGLSPAGFNRRFRYVDSLRHISLLLQAWPGALSAETSLQPASTRLITPRTSRIGSGCHEPDWDLKSGSLALD